MVDMATNGQAIVNPPASFRSAVWKYYGFLTKDYLQNLLSNSIAPVQLQA